MVDEELNPIEAKELKDFYDKSNQKGKDNTKPVIKMEGTKMSDPNKTEQPEISIPPEKPLYPDLYVNRSHNWHNTLNSIKNLPKKTYSNISRSMSNVKNNYKRHTRDWVIGTSIAGVLAVSVLGDYFDPYFGKKEAVRGTSKENVITAEMPDLNKEIAEMGVTFDSTQSGLEKMLPVTQPELEEFLDPAPDYSKIELNKAAKLYEEPKETWQIKIGEKGAIEAVKQAAVEKGYKRPADTVACNLVDKMQKQNKIEVTPETDHIAGHKDNGKSFNVDCRDPEADLQTYSCHDDMRDDYKEGSVFKLSINPSRYGFEKVAADTVVADTMAAGTLKADTSRAAADSAVTDTAMAELYVKAQTDTIKADSTQADTAKAIAQQEHTTTITNEKHKSHKVEIAGICVVVGLGTALYLLIRKYNALKKEGEYGSPSPIPSGGDAPSKDGPGGKDYVPPDASLEGKTLAAEIPTTPDKTSMGGLAAILSGRYAGMEPLIANYNICRGNVNKAASRCGMSNEYAVTLLAEYVMDYIDIKNETDLAPKLGIYNRKIAEKTLMQHDMLRLYGASTDSLEKIAQKLQDKYGMHVSASTISKYGKAHYEVSSRKEINDIRIKKEEKIISLAA